jgi:hypothetical protein
MSNAKEIALEIRKRNDKEDHINNFIVILFLILILPIGYLIKNCLFIEGWVNILLAAGIDILICGYIANKLQYKH